MNVKSLKQQIAELDDDCIVLVGDHTLQVVVEGRYVDIEETWVD